MGEDEIKIVALRDYVWRLMQKKTDVSNDAKMSLLKNLIPLKEIDVQPEVVLFDQDKEHLDALQSIMANDTEQIEGPQTITDALLDASTNLKPHDAVASLTGPSSTGTDTPQSGTSSVSTIQRPQGQDRQSLLKLMQGQGPRSKAIAEIGTSPTNAHGRVDGNKQTRGTPTMMAA